MVSLTLLSLFPANYSFDYNSCVSKVASSSTLNRGLEAEGEGRNKSGKLPNTVVVAYCIHV